MGGIMQGFELKELGDNSKGKESESSHAIVQTKILTRANKRLDHRLACNAFYLSFTGRYDVIMSLSNIVNMEKSQNNGNLTGTGRKALALTLVVECLYLSTVPMPNWCVDKSMKESDRSLIQQELKTPDSPLFGQVFHSSSSHSFFNSEKACEHLADIATWANETNNKRQ